MDNDPANTPQDTNQTEPVVAAAPPDTAGFDPVGPSPSDPVPTDATGTPADTAPVIDVVTPTPTPDVSATGPSDPSAPMESSSDSTYTAATPVADETAVGNTPASNQAPVVAPVVAPISSPVKKSSKTTLILIIVLVVAVIVAAAVYFLVIK